MTAAVSCAYERVAGTRLRVVSRIQECHQPIVTAPLKGADTSRRRDQLPILNLPTLLSFNDPQLKTRAVGATL